MQTIQLHRLDLHRLFHRLLILWFLRQMLVFPKESLSIVTEIIGEHAPGTRSQPHALLSLVIYANSYHRYDLCRISICLVAFNFGRDDDGNDHLCSAAAQLVCHSFFIFDHHGR